MSWFKKILGWQYGFNSQSSSQSSSQGSLQEPKVHYVTAKTKTDGNDTKIENVAISEFQECDDATQSTQDSCYSWRKDEKRELSGDEEEPWWESSKLQSSQKSTQETQLQEFKKFTS